jgi:transposase InsO family protein
MTRDGVPVDSKVAAAVAAKAHGAKFDVTAFCADAQISTKTFYKYLGRFKAEGILGLYPRLRTPKTSPTRTPAAVEDAVVRVRKELDLRGECGDNGATSILWRLQDEAMVSPPSRATINRILVRRGMVVPQPQKKPNAAKVRRFEMAAPNDMWHMDSCCYRLRGGQTVRIIQLGDDCSRLDLGDLAAVSENSIDVCAATRAAIAQYGLPRAMLTDNGPAFNGHRQGFTTALETMLRGLGVTPISTSNGHPQTNGKNERGHSTLQRWLKRQPPAATLDELQTLLDQYRHWYNCETSGVCRWS